MISLMWRRTCSVLVDVYIKHLHTWHTVKAIAVEKYSNGQVVVDLDNGFSVEARKEHIHNVDALLESVMGTVEKREQQLKQLFVAA